MQEMIQMLWNILTVLLILTIDTAKIILNTKNLKKLSFLWRNSLFAISVLISKYTDQLVTWHELNLYLNYTVSEPLLMYNNYFSSEKQDRLDLADFIIGQKTLETLQSLSFI